EGVRLRLDSPAMIDRGVVFMAAHPAFELYRWFPTPDAAQRAAIAAAAAHLDTFGDGWSPLIAGRDRGPCLARQRLRAGALPRRSRPVLAATAVASPALPAAQRRRGLARRGTVGARAVDRRVPRRSRARGRGRDRLAGDPRAPLVCRAARRRRTA